MRIIILFLVSSIVMLFAGCATTVTMKHDPASYLDFTAVQKNKLGLTEVQNRIVRFNEGDRIPLRISVNSRIAGLSADKIDIIVKKKVFVLVKNENPNAVKIFDSLTTEEAKAVLSAMKIYISTDETNWRLITKIQDIQEALGIEGGMVTASFFFTKENGFGTELTLKTIAFHE
jgi:hypothetical protein